MKEKRSRRQPVSAQVSHCSLAVGRGNSARRAVSTRYLLGALLFTTTSIGTVHAADIKIEEITLEQLNAGYASGRFTAAKVTQAYLDRISKYEATYNAYTAINPRALDEANESDRRRKVGDPLGPLEGVPVAIKESLDMAGFPQTMGWDKLSPESGGIALIPVKDATVVERLRKAGAIILGRTNMPAFAADGSKAASSWAGETRNVYDLLRAPGASSSGTATAVSGNLALLGIAEETGGSIQNPAGAQGLVGIKTSFGLVPGSGVVPLRGSTHDVIGVHGRTVRDAAVMLDVIAGYSFEDPKTIASIGHLPEGGYTSMLRPDALKGKRIGLYGVGWTPKEKEISAETKRLYERAVEELERRGAIVVKDPFDGTNIGELITSSSTKIGVQPIAFDMERYLRNYPADAPVRSVKELFDKTNDWPVAWQKRYETREKMPDPASVPDLSKFVETKATGLRIIDEVMKKHRLDAFVYPQALWETPLLSEKKEVEPTTVPVINITGLPQINVPAGVYEDGMPFSLAFFGRMWSEADLLGMAYDYEQATHYRKVPLLTETQASK